MISKAIWIRCILEDMRELQNEAIEIYCDSKSTIAMTKNHVLQIKTKHISIKYHFLREVEANKEIKLKHCKIEEHLVDIITKALPKVKFEQL